MAAGDSTLTDNEILPYKMQVEPMNLVVVTHNPSQAFPENMCHTHGWPQQTWYPITWKDIYWNGNRFFLLHSKQLFFRV